MATREDRGRRALVAAVAMAWTTAAATTARGGDETGDADCGCAHWRVVPEAETVTTPQNVSPHARTCPLQPGQAIASGAARGADARWTARAEVSNPLALTCVLESPEVTAYGWRERSVDWTMPDCAPPRGGRLRLVVFAEVRGDSLYRVGNLRPTEGEAGTESIAQLSVASTWPLDGLGETSRTVTADASGAHAEGSMEVRAGGGVGRGALGGDAGVRWTVHNDTARLTVSRRLLVDVRSPVLDGLLGHHARLHGFVRVAAWTVGGAVQARTSARTVIHEFALEVADPGDCIPTMPGVPG